MLNATQRQCTTSRTRCWAATVLFLAAALLPLLQPQNSARSTESFPSFPPGGIQAVSLSGDSTNTALPVWAISENIEQAHAFGMDAELLTQNDVSTKWSEVKLKIARELQIVDRCRSENACPPGAQRLINLSAEGAGRSGRAKVGFINRAVDLAISPISDEAQWHVPDHWSTPLETLRAGRGDCEDYAIVKYAALLDAGMSESDLKIVLVRTVFPSEAHAVVAARVDGEWLILQSHTCVGP